MKQSNRRSSRIKIILILAIILFLPGFFYYFLKTKGVNQYADLPFYGVKKEGRDNYLGIPSVKLLNAWGEYAFVPARDSTVSVVNFFYISCPQFCDRMNQKMLSLADRFSKSDMVRFYSISLNSQDSPSDLAEYINMNEFARDNWGFYTDSSNAVQELSHNKYLLDAIGGNTKTGAIIHTPMLVLLDAHNRIRGYYNSTNPKELERMQDEMMVLITEVRRNKK